MNYLGHAYLAELECPDPIFILGAMLPDLVNLAQVRARPLALGALGLGMQFHHESDRAFHQHEEFRTGQTQLTQLFLEQGVRKGPSRALAHIGIEFLLDAGYADPAAGYLGALRAGAQVPGAFSCYEEADQKRLAHLCGYLLNRGREPFQITPERLSQRLERTLSGRQRLCPTGVELDLATSELCRASPFWLGRSVELASSVLAHIRATNWQMASISSNLPPCP